MSPTNKQNKKIFKLLFLVFPLHKNTFVIQDEWRCRPVDPVIIRNGFYVAMNYIKDIIIVVKAGCTFKAYSEENKTGQSHLAEGPVVLLEGFPFTVQSYECHCPKLLKIDCIPEEKFIQLPFSSTTVKFIDFLNLF